MKYLKGRDNYLNELKVNSGLVPYAKNDSIASINEEVMTNTITWGDSLLGRLINSAIRKAKVGVNLVRISSVIKSLYKLFDEMVADGVIKEMPVVSRIKIYKFALIKFIEEIEKVAADPSDYVLNEPGVEVEVEDIDEIKNMTDGVITEIEKYMSDIISTGQSSGEIPKNEIDELELDKKDLIDALTKFRESLDEIKAPEGDKEETSVVSEPKKETGLVYSENMANNLKSVYMILFYYHQTILSKKPASGVNKAEVVKKPQPENIVKSSVVDKSKVAESVLLNESVLNPNLSNAIKPLYTYFKNEGQFTFPSESKGRENEFHKFLSGNKDGILKVYKSISLIKEDLKTLLTKPEKVGGHIFNLYKTTRTKPNGDFQGVDGDFQSQIKIFNTTMKSILDSIKVETKVETSEDGVEVGKKYKYTNKEGETKDVLVVDKDKVVQPGPDKKFLTGDDKKGKELESGLVSVASDKSKVTFPVSPESLKKESKLISSYLDFIKEADENKDTWLVKVHESWRNNFLGNFKNLKKYKLTQEEVDKLTQEVEKASKNTKSLKIVGKDPVIEVVRLFNRAYRLHTTQVIPTGRSGGKVSNKTFMEYTCFGSGSPDTAGQSGGPYRNNAVFSKWENAVLDIVSSSKYRIIFNEEATIQVGEGNPVKDFGRKLLNFMNELLDDTQLYKEGEQKKFINKYFNVDIQTKELNSPGKNDTGSNDKLSKQQKQKNVDFTEQDEIKFEEGQIFKFNYKEGTLYGYVYSIKNNKTYIKFSKNHLFVKKYLPGDIKFKTNPKSVDGPVYFAEIKGTKLTKNTYKLDSCLDVSKKVEKNEVDKSFNIEFRPSKMYLLKEDGSTESYTVNTQADDFDSNRFLVKRDSKKPKGFDGWYKLFIS